MTISEVSKKYELTEDTIRYYERIGLLPKVPRNKSGIRDFDESSCNWLEFIKCMRNSGMEIEVLIEYVNLFKQGDSTLQARKKLLEEQKQKLMEKENKIKNTLKRLDYKINLYNEIIRGEREDFKIEP